MATVLYSRYWGLIHLIYLKLCAFWLISPHFLLPTAPGNLHFTLCSFETTRNLIYVVSCSLFLLGLVYFTVYCFPDSYAYFQMHHLYTSNMHSFKKISRIFISKFLWMMCRLWVPTILFLSDSQPLPLSMLWVTQTYILCVWGGWGRGRQATPVDIGHLKSWCETDFQFGFQHNTDPLLSNGPSASSVSPINNLQEAGRRHTALLLTMFSLCHEMAKADVF